MMGITSTPSGIYTLKSLLQFVLIYLNLNVIAMRGPSSAFGVGAAVANNKRDDVNQAVSNTFSNN